MCAFGAIKGPPLRILDNRVGVRADTSRSVVYEEGDVNCKIFGGMLEKSGAISTIFYTLQSGAHYF